ncbi:MAG: 5-formyltetrahydrofolate cyclo-ligase [Leptospiraceae bacterium]|nr:5-formyltetrahydrofolate cyclo-ligase [Leptospiraceae bacterium]
MFYASMNAEKTEIRKEAKLYWKEFLKDTRKIERMFEFLIQSLKIYQPKRIFAYFPIENEFPVDRIFGVLQSEIYLPVIINNQDMKFSLYKKDGQFFPLGVNHFGIKEPLEMKEGIPHENDLVIIPSLGCNQDFVRLGRGGGFYDRYFSKNPSSRLSIKLSIIPEDLTQLSFMGFEHDLILDLIITENNIVYKQKKIENM